MVAKGNVNKHRYTYSGGIKAVEEQKWGRDKARERYGSLKYENDPPPPPKNNAGPQRLGDSSNLRGPGYANEAPQNSWLRGGGESAEGKPNFDKGKRR